MEALFIYLLKSAGILTIFFLAYKLLLQKETFFNLNRHYLLGGIIASLLLPLVVFKSYIYIEPIVATVEEPVFYDMPVSIIENSAAIQTTPFDWNALVFNIYILGVIIISVQFLIQLFSLYRIVRSGTLKHYSSFKLIEVSKDVSPFSFFNYIVYNPTNFSEKDLEIILNHEKAHGKQLHSIDILLSQLFVIFQWFNPIVWFYKKTIQQNLEFMADKEAISNIESKKKYQHTLLKVSVATYCTSITNNFYNSLIKKRIVMLNQTSSKTRNLWKYVLILPVLAIFLVSFNTKEITVVKEAITTEFLVEPTSSNTDLKEIESHFKSNKNVMLKFNDLKRNNSGELTSISVNTKYRKNNRFMKRLSFKPKDGQKAIEAFKLNYDNTEQSFLLTKTDVGAPESKIMENTIKLLADFSVSEIPTKTDSSLGDNPLYIINGEKIKSDKLATKQMSLDGEVIQLGKKEGKEQYGDEGKDGVLIFKGKTTMESTKENSKNEVIVKITKDTTKEELDRIEKDLQEKGIYFSYSGVDYNSSKEITSIKIKYKDEKSNSTGTYHVSGDDNDPIKTIYVYKKENGGIGIGNSPDGREHEEYMKAHTENLKEHKARMEEHKERIYEHKQRMKEHNEKTKEEHEVRMEEHRARMEEHKATMEKEHEGRLKEMKERHEEMNVEKEERLQEHKERMEEHKERIEEHKAKMEVEHEGRLKKMKERHEEIKVEKEERMHNLEERRTKILKERKERKVKGEKDNTFVYTTDGDDGDKNTFVYRASTNENIAKKALFVVNGKVIKNGDISDIDPDNIASVNVLKDKSAITMYGEKGKDGVVQITTKSNQSPWKVSYAVNSVENNKGLKNEENMFLISKTSTKEDLDNLKRKLSSSNIDFSFSKLKRNKNGEIIRIKIALNNNKGSKSSSSYDTGNEGIPDIWVGKTGSGKVTLSSVN